MGPERKQTILHRLYGRPLPRKPNPNIPPSYLHLSILYVHSVGCCIVSTATGEKNYMTIITYFVAGSVGSCTLKQKILNHSHHFFQRIILPPCQFSPTLNLAHKNCQCMGVPFAIRENNNKKIYLEILSGSPWQWVILFSTSQWLRICIRYCFLFLVFFDFLLYEAGQELSLSIWLLF